MMSSAALQEASGLQLQRGFLPSMSASSPLDMSQYHPYNQLPAAQIPQDIPHHFYQNPNVLEQSQQSSRDPSDFNLHARQFPTFSMDQPVPPLHEPSDSQHNQQLHHQFTF